MVRARKPRRGQHWTSLRKRAGDITRHWPEIKLRLTNLIPPEVLNAMTNNQLDSLVCDDNYFQISHNNFIDQWTILVMVEHFYQFTMARKHDQFDVELEMIQCVHGSPMPHVTLRGVSKGLMALAHSDLVVLEDEHEYNSFEISGFKDDLVGLSSCHLSDSRKYNVSFVPGVIMYKTIYHALDNAQVTLARKALFNVEVDSPPTDQEFRSLDLNTEPRYKTILDERFAKCSQSQQQAINGVWRASCRPRPYIVLGPPGSGKTFTIVEMIARLFHGRPHDNILVCVSSEERACQLVAAIHETKLVDSVARACATNPPQTKVVVASIDIVGGSIERSRCFEYVIIDDACRVYEPKTLIPFNFMTPNGCLVLVGDPKQLGPLVNCPHAEKFGLGQSTLERLLGLDHYARHPRRGYNKDYITELQESYRCDPWIFEPCNKLFYGDKVQCRARTPVSLMRMLNLTHPFVFKSVLGHEGRNSGIISRCNPIEADECVAMVIELLKIGLNPKQIGVVTFYSYQAQEIEDRLIDALETDLGDIIEARKGLPKNLDYLDESSLPLKSDPNLFACHETNKGPEEADSFVTAQGTKREQLTRWLCKVNTVERFQGDEREVIIVSTVKCPESTSCIENWKELTDSRGFNVAMSRAKWLTMVLGHPSVLNCHYNWQEFSKHVVYRNPYPTRTQIRAKKLGLTP